MGGLHKPKNIGLNILFHMKTFKINLISYSNPFIQISAKLLHISYNITKIDFISSQKPMETLSIYMRLIAKHKVLSKRLFLFKNSAKPLSFAIKNKSMNKVSMDFFCEVTYEIYFGYIV